MPNNKCVNCKLCLKVCPQNSDNTGSEILQVYAALSRNDTLRAKSSSGGLFSEFAKQILKKGGTVYGVTLTENLTAKHISIHSEKELHLLQGSKYLQSHAANSFENVAAALTAGENVLFSGTPCQIHALKIYLKKEYDNLITIDTLCHGVPSPLVFKKYIEYNQKKRNEKICNVNFRAKKPGWVNYGTELIFSDGYTEIENSFQHFFINNYCLSSSCHNCKYSSKYRYSDITLGDFWGYKESAPSYIENDNLGISFVGINTGKGKKLFNSLKSNIDFTPETLVNAAVNNTTLTHSEKENPDSALFWERFNSMSWDELVDSFSISSGPRKDWMTEEQHTYYSIPYAKRHLLHKARITKKKVLSKIKGCTK